MAKKDETRISKTMAFLLRHRPDLGSLEPDENGWVELEELVGAVSELMSLEIAHNEVRNVVSHSHVKRFEIRRTRIRAITRSRQPRPTQPPDILYFPTTRERVASYMEGGFVNMKDREHLVLAPDEPSAWRSAHRLRGDPEVLFVDATRARRHGARFWRRKGSGSFMSSPISTKDVLNLRPNFAPQLSAGGIPMIEGADGNPRLALIRVTRRSGVTWEVAKGKLEPGETPESCAIREVREEMGIQADLEIDRYVGDIRYGFMAPGGLPRLKTVYLYLMKPVSQIDDEFYPAQAEGIDDVQWFTVSDAVEAVTHTSLRPFMRRVGQLLAT
jgi:putative RNA 2'-phosphotransferase